ncbi:MAG: PEP-CTERM sorting domain-containing protein [Fimbriimonadaceae bacterium]|nr:PEP-CTERM sorting domain-containing protein [Fimbriimonadaceae bacterium]
MRTQYRLMATSAAALTLICGATPAFAGLVINPVFDSSITSDPNSAAIQNSINSMISLYQAKFTDNITVKVYFQKGGGLGSSTFGYYWNNASVAISAMTADATSADDAVAVSHLGTNVFGSVAYTSANGRALGLDTPGFLSAGGGDGFDGIISLNTGICFTTHDSPVAGQFDLYSAAAHELDEVLGTPSGASGALAFAPDLYRYDGGGNRSFSGDTAAHAYFSIDSTTLINEYNQFGRTDGDWGDWVAHSPSQTQDWTINSGITINPGEPEFRLLDVIGYNRAPVPEPASMTVLALGAIALIRKRSKK